MFAQTFVDTAASGRKPWTMAASLGIQCTVVGTLLMVPLLHPEVLYPRFETRLWVPVRSAPEPPRHEPVVSRSSQRLAPRQVFTAPTAIPTRVAKIVDTIADAPEAPGVYIPGASTNWISGLPAGITAFALPDRPIEQKPPPQRVQPKAPPGPVNISGGVQAAKLLFGPAPPYPPMARATRSQGTVRLQAVIALDGHISGLKVVSGPTLLVKAAVDAVSQWRYQPTLLSGMPVEVLTEIDVIFTLN